MIQNHPSLSYNQDNNFWEEFPAYKAFPILGEIYRLNSKSAKARKSSSNFMWVLALCYDRVSPFFAQPEEDKWEATAEDILKDPEFFKKLLKAREEEKHLNEVQKVLTFPNTGGINDIIYQFQKTVDTPLGMALRALEKKLDDRTKFIMDTPYTMDEWVKPDGGKMMLKKGSASSLDKMLGDTSKITTLVQDAMDKLKNSTGTDTGLKGGGQASLSDGDKSF